MNQTNISTDFLINITNVKSQNKKAKNKGCIIEKLGNDGKEIQSDKVEEAEDVGIIAGFINFFSRTFTCFS